MKAEEEEEWEVGPNHYWLIIWKDDLGGADKVINLNIYEPTFL